MSAQTDILRKVLVTSNIDSIEWSGVHAELRDRAFFSSKVEEENVLHTMRQVTAEVAGGNLSASEARLAIREALEIAQHPSAGNKNEATLTNLSSKARLDLIIRQNRDAAYGYVQYVSENQPGSLAAFPCLELIRSRNAKKPRDWAQRWRAAGGKLYDGRMIALKNDQVWTKISRFGQPWYPFDFNSSMVTESVPRSEAIALGVIQPNDPPPVPSKTHLNDNLSGSIPNSPDTYDHLKKCFGDQVTIDETTNRIRWRNDISHTSPGEATPTLNLGAPSAQKSLLRKMTDSPVLRSLSKSMVGMGQLIFSSEALRQVSSKDILPIDYSLIPSMWRNPDRVFPGEDAGTMVLEIDSLNGDVFRLLIRISESNIPLQSPKIIRFYRSPKE